MTVTIDAALIEQITRTIVERYQPRRIVLFGSHARGDRRPDSDLDLFVEMETPLSPPERATAIRRVFGLHPWPMDILVYTPEEAQRPSAASSGAERRSSSNHRQWRYAMPPRL